MPRKSRDFYLSNFYHIMVQGDERKFIFYKGYYKDKYIYLINKNAIRNDIKIIAYCIMNNHAHILVYSKDIIKVSKMMQQCNTSYGKYYSKERNNVGHVFRDRFKSEAIYDKRYLLNCIKYIHANPVKANIENSNEKYEYSSFNKYLNKENPLYEDVIKICELTEDEYNDIVYSSNAYMDLEYLDDDIKEKVNIVFKEIKETYDLKNLTTQEIEDIYMKLKTRCKISKTQIATLLKMKRTTLSDKLKKAPSRMSVPTDEKNTVKNERPH